jgi:hypothetical protein
VLAHRAALVEALYANPPPPAVMAFDSFATPSAASRGRKGRRPAQAS